MKNHNIIEQFEPEDNPVKINKQSSDHFEIHDNFRHIPIPFHSPKPAFKSNRVITARYSALTWIPKSILFQFSRINNIYFLIMSVLSFMPFSPKNPFSLAGTLAAVLIFTMFKEGYEDLARHRQDNEVNKKLFLKYCWNNKDFVEVPCEKIQVGDILKIEENQGFPADLVLIGTSNPKGVAFVNTMNMDGETNLKEKVIAYKSIGNCKLLDFDTLEFELQVDQPNISLVKWNCNISNLGNLEPLSFKQLLLRGCLLKNTEFIYGIAVYTGTDSKIVMNSKKPAAKSSKIQKSMNWILLSVFIFQIFICFFLASFGQEWLIDHEDSSYIDLPSASGGSYISRVLTYWVGYSHLIPISLYVALELVRLFLANFIRSDLSMYDSSMDRAANCRASDLIEELGQVQFVFSDKTGTLTCNEMVLRQCSVNEEVFGSMTGEIWQDELMMKKIETDATMKEFCLMLALCNSVFPAFHENEFVYQASSPDELALVTAAASIGFELIDKSEDKVVVKVKGETEEWQALAEVPFDSYRKRMSVVMRKPQSGEIVLYTKGADTTVLPLCQYIDSEKVNQELDHFAESGLRTLVFASRILSQSEFSDWFQTWKHIQTENNECKEDLLREHGSQIEKNLNLIAITAIEDKLQAEVPETIQSLMDSGIRVWVLTGDKEQTAIEIAKSCNLIQPGTTTYKFFHSSKSETHNKLSSICQELGISSTSSFDLLDRIKSALSTQIAVVVNGLTLSFIMEDESLKPLFFFLSYLANSCICCRVSPAQKMQVVKLTSSFGKWTTLSIGDGANDVSMIQEANIGVGISGKEGTQAVQASDFYFSQFKSLKPLLLVHGRYAYMRISLFILYYFYKNFLSVFTEIWFAFFSGFSGQIFFLDWLPAMYNTFWTSWPCLTFFTLEKDLQPKDSLEYVGLYSAGQKSRLFNIKQFWIWVAFSALSATWIFWLPVFACEQGTSANGRQISLFWMSTVSFMMLLHTVNLKLMIVSRFWNKYSIFTIFLSFLLFYLVTLVLSSGRVAVVFQPELNGMFTEVLANGKTWVVVVVGPVLALLPDFLYCCLEDLFFPSPARKVARELKRNRLGIKG